jgi:hypothetical protein
MKAIGNAVYLLIFISFVRKIFDKVKAPFEHEIRVEHHDGQDSWYVMANGKPVVWQDCKESAMVFCWNACAKCKSLCTKLKVVGTDDELVLVDTASIPGLSLEEIVALDDTIDESE